jgi:iron complex outermembrane receptor protein
MKTLLILGAALAPFAAVLAADDTAKPQALTPVVVTGTRSEETENRLPAAVTVITREQIERSGASHVVEVLRASGVAQISDLYGDGSRAQVDVRGFGDTFQSNTLILVDGRRLNNPDMAAPDLNSIALKDVERIEIVQGSAGVLYGDQAVGGVVNIITRSIQKTSAQVEASAGSYSNYGVRAQGSQRLGNFAYRLSAEERGSNNYRNHNGTEYRNFFGYTEYNYGKDSRVFGEAGYADEDLELPGALTAAQMAQDRKQVQPGSKNDFADTRTKNFRLGLDQDLIGDWKFAGEGSHRNSHGNIFLGGAASTQDREINELTPRIVSKFGLPTGLAQLTFGADGQKARYAFRIPAFAFTQTNNQELRDLYTQLIVPLPVALEATVGGRIARMDNDTNASTLKFGDTAYGAELGLAWRPVKQSRIFARYEKNFRFAKVDEFTFVAASCEPGKPLCTQTGKSYEIGSEWTDKGWSAAVSFYRLDLNKEIAFDPSVGFFGANSNLPPTRRDGQSLRLSWQALEMLSLGATYQHVDARVTEGTLKGREIPMVASQTGTFSADVNLPLQLVLHTELAATSNRTFGGDFQNNFGKLAGYTSTNLALSKNSGTWQFTARVNNLFNSEYSEYGVAGGFPAAQTFYPSPKLNGLLTVRYVY